MTLRIIFFGNSQSVFSNRHFHTLWQTPCDLVGVVDSPPTKRGSTNLLTNPFQSFRELAHQRGIPIFEPPTPNLPPFVAEISDLNPDLFIAVGYTNILQVKILSIPNILAVNFHASLLPAYRGKHPVFWCLRNGDRWSGLTVHVMDAAIDKGDILYQVRVRIRKDDTVSSLYERIMIKSVELVKRLIEDAENDALIRRPQVEEGASYFYSVTKDEFRLDWSGEAEKLRRWITITPGECYTNIAGKQVYFLDAEIEKTDNRSDPGEILYLGKARGVIAVGNGALSLRYVKIEKGDKFTFPDLCRRLGYKQGDSVLL